MSENQNINISEGTQNFPKQKLSLHNSKFDSLLKKPLTSVENKISKFFIFIFIDILLSIGDKYTLLSDKNNFKSLSQNKSKDISGIKLNETKKESTKKVVEKSNSNKENNKNKDKGTNKDEINNLRIALTDQLNLNDIVRKIYLIFGLIILQLRNKVKNKIEEINKLREQIKEKDDAIYELSLFYEVILK